MDYLTTNRGKKCLSVDGYMYLFVRNMKDGTSSWRCRMRRAKSNRAGIGNVCNALVWVKDGSLVRGPTPEHSHEPDWGKVHVKKVLTDIKETARHNKTANPSSLYLEAMKGACNLPEEAVAKLPDKENIKRTIRIIQAKDYEKNPKHLSSLLQLPDEFCSLLNQKWLIKDTGTENANRQFIFASPEGLRSLLRGKFLIMDGTFSTVPKIMHQLYTIHSNFGSEGKFLPCVYSVMCHKNKESYIELFSALKHEIAATFQEELNPRFISIDYESGAIPAVQECFPGATIAGCLFHFSQILFRRLQSCGLQEIYQKKHEESLRKDFHSLIALAFVPVGEVQEAFDDLVDSIDNRLMDVCTFLEDNYIRGRRTGRREFPPKFPPETWNCYERALEGLPRTINSVEGWHLKFNLLCTKKHLGLFKFLEELQNAEIDANYDRIILETGGKLRCRSKIYEDLDTRVRRITGRYEEYKQNGEIKRYLSALGCCVGGIGMKPKEEDEFNERSANATEVYEVETVKSNESSESHRHDMGIQSTDMDVQYLRMDVQPSNEDKLQFLPVSISEQKEMCVQYGLTYKKKSAISIAPYEFSRFSGPEKTSKIIGDGNCYYRAISFILTGSQTAHKTVRKLVCDYQGPSERSERMRRNGEWAEIDDITATADMLRRKIYVWSLFGSEMTWHVHVPTDNQPENGSLYLDHSSGNHFEVVQSVNKLA